MPRYSVTGPDGMLYDWLVADSPLEALYQLHGEALGPKAVAIVDGALVFSDPAEQELCAGSWLITELRAAGATSTTIEIMPPQRAAA
jgi:hypothetical protein